MNVLKNKSKYVSIVFLVISICSFWICLNSAYGPQLVTRSIISIIGIVGSLLMAFDRGPWRRILMTWAMIQIPYIAIDTGGSLTEQLPISWELTFSYLSYLNNELLYFSEKGVNLFGVLLTVFTAITIRLDSGKKVKKPYFLSIFIVLVLSILGKFTSDGIIEFVPYAPSDVVMRSKIEKLLPEIATSIFDDYQQNPHGVVFWVPINRDGGTTEGVCCDHSLSKYYWFPVSGNPSLRGSMKAKILAAGRGYKETFGSYSLDDFFVEKIEDVSPWKGRPFQNGSESIKYFKKFPIYRVVYKRKIPEKLVNDNSLKSDKQVGFNNFKSYSFEFFLGWDGSEFKLVKDFNILLEMNLDKLRKS